MKDYEGDVSELGLDFTVATEALGVTTHVDLKPNGSHIAVDNHNRYEYVHLMADYKLNKQVGACSFYPWNIIIYVAEGTS